MVKKVKWNMMFITVFWTDILCICKRKHEPWNILWFIGFDSHNRNLLGILKQLTINLWNFLFTALLILKREGVGYKIGSVNPHHLMGRVTVNLPLPLLLCFSCIVIGNHSRESEVRHVFTYTVPLMWFFCFNIPSNRTTEQKLAVWENWNTFLVKSEFWENIFFIWHNQDQEETWWMFGAIWAGADMGD